MPHFTEDPPRAAPLAAGAACRITLRVYAELRDFLVLARRGGRLTLDVRERDSVKDVIEALGIPHTEVDLVLANGAPVDFAYRVHEGDRIAVYPPFRTLDVRDVSRVRPPPLEEARFVLDQHLGTLASHLRLLGFDTLYRNDYEDPMLAQISADDDRILLTRDRGLLKRGQVVRGYHVWATDPERQVVEVLRRFSLARAVAPFRRCMRCNGVLAPVPKADIVDRLPPKTRQFFDDFRRCQDCDQIYWRGGHYQRMLRLVDEWLASARLDRREA